MRFEVLRRDDHTCRYCGASAPDAKLTVDHVLPVALGGQNDPSNLVTACRDCNAGKSSTSPDAAVVADVDESARQWASAVKAAAEVFRQEDADLAGSLADFYDYYSKHTRWNPPRDWDNSVITFLTRGLVAADLEHFVLISSAKGFDWNDTWRYFCGCCWRRIRDIDDLAKKVYDARRGGDDE
jgi:hypothetical protein